MPNTRPSVTTQAALDDKLQRAASKSLVNYGFFIGATAENLPDLQTAGSVCGIKIFILHLSTGVEAELLRQEKLSWVTAEVTPQHLLLNTNAEIVTLAQMNPPLRSPENNQILWQALLDGENLT